MSLLLPLTILVILFIYTQCEEETFWKPHVKIVTKPTHPFTYEQNGVYRGFIPDLIELVFKDTNITHDLYLVPDNKYGSQDDDGKWDGLMGEVVNGPADVIIAPLTITENRLASVEFSFPFMPASLVPVVRKPERGAKLPFNGLDDLLEKTGRGTLSYGVLKGGASEQLLKDGKYQLYKEIHDQLLSKVTDTYSPFVSSYSEAFERIRSDSSYVFFGEDVALEFIAGRPPCDLVVWGKPINTGFYGIAFNKSVPKKFLNLVNERLVEASSSGELKQLKNTWWQNECSKDKLCVCQSRQKGPHLQDHLSRNRTNDHSSEEGTGH